MRTLTSQQDKSHQQKRHRNDRTSDRQLGTCPFILRAEPPHRQNPQNSPEKKREAQAPAHASLLSAVNYFLHPEQEAQQSSDAQQPACAAVAAPARPSAITAINTTTFSFFMIFLLCI